MPQLTVLSYPIREGTMARPRAENPRTKITNIRLTEEERIAFEATAAAKGYKNVSEYIRFLHRTSNESAEELETAGD